MHDTTKRVEIVERRVRYHRTRKSIHRLMVLCGTLCFSLLFILHQTSGPAYPVIYGMYGTILLHENVGGYVLVAVATFMLAVVITVVCMRLHEREKQKQKQEQEHKEDAT